LLRFFTQLGLISQIEESGVSGQRDKTASKHIDSISIGNTMLHLPEWFAAWIHP